VIGKIGQSSTSTESLAIMAEIFNGLKTISQILEAIQKEGKGLVLFMRPAAKSNAALLESLRLLKKQGAEGKEMKIPVEMTQRDFGVGAQILRDLDVCKLRLLTNHPRRRVGLIGYGLEIVENVPFL
jgi:3,4-dihydroxy 2-butanone 4-phosphate synthase/GTP cyclohydrolase II